MNIIDGAAVVTSTVSESLLAKSENKLVKYEKWLNIYLNDNKFFTFG